MLENKTNFMCPHACYHRPGYKLWLFTMYNITPFTQYSSLLSSSKVTLKVSSPAAAAAWTTLLCFWKPSLKNPDYALKHCMITYYIRVNPPTLYTIHTCVVILQFGFE